MSLLKRGITGFNVPRDTIYYTKKEIAGFFQHPAYPYTRVGAVEEPGPANNYFRVRFVNAIRNEISDVLVHEHLPLSAAAEDTDGQMIPVFKEMPEEIGRLLELNGIRVLSPAELNTKVPPGEWSVLGPEEREQALYWSSETYGEVIFNCYD
ncbi:MAG: hypothetical protein IBJ09_02065 [Bacteroidia bacterium]|nr:hypothetical protein [Bacteroidia bacterium]